MTNEEAKEILKLDQNAQCPVSLVESYIRCGEEWLTSNEEMKVREAIAVAIKALSQEPSVWDDNGELTEYGEKCRDRIFEQDPCTDAISRQAAIDCITYDEEYTVECLKALSPVNPAEKVGYWIDTGSAQECSECHEIQYGYDNHRFYCPNCGCRMVEPQESEDNE